MQIRWLRQDGSSRIRQGSVGGKPLRRDSGATTNQVGRTRFQELTQVHVKYKHFPFRRGGRVAEGGGLLNRYTLKRRIMGSNPILSANLFN
jgi:hypothetical protein